MPTTDYGAISAAQAANFASTALIHAEPYIELARFGMTQPMPKNKSNLMIFRRSVTFGALTVPLIEGVTPSSQQMSYERVEFTLRQYGKPIEYTDVVADLAMDPVVNDAVILAGEQAALTAEIFLWGQLKAGTSVFYTNGTTRTAVNTPLVLAKVQAATRYLSAQKARPVTAMVAPGIEYATRAIEPAYIAMGHTNLNSDIRALPGFMPASQYGKRTMVSPNELGSVENTRFITSPEFTAYASGGGLQAGSGTSMVSTDATAADVYPLIVFGKDAFCNIPLKGENAFTPMIVRPTPSDSDPMAQRGYVSIKMYLAGGILNQSWITRVECAATAL